jgi:hypothetical protein
MTILREIPQPVQAAFSRMCKDNDWSEEELLTFLMRRAIKEDISLALPITTQRNDIFKKGIPKWTRELTASLVKQ